MIDISLIADCVRSVNELLAKLDMLKKFLLLRPVVLKMRNIPSLPSLYIEILT